MIIVSISNIFNHLSWLGHSPVISQLKPGVVTVVHTAGEVEKYFVPGGFAFTHPDSVTVNYF